MMMSEMLEGAKRVALFGHTRPDGDCVGSVLGLYNYIKDNYPKIHVDAYLEKFSHTFNFLSYSENVFNKYEEGTAYDTVFVLDASSRDRVGANGLACVAQADRSFNIDHHVSNPGDVCIYSDIQPDVSSASEVLYYLLELEKISKRTAECIFLGIAHDTGVFRFECTGKRTFEAVAQLIDKGVDFPRIINDTYYSRTYVQNRVTGLVMERSKLALSGKVIYGYLTPAEMAQYGVNSLEMDGIIDALREVEGTEVALFIYPTAGRYKISLRSQYYVDVSKICEVFGGGGHVRAAGCTMDGTPEEIVERILKEVEKQI